MNRRRRTPGSIPARLAGTASLVALTACGGRGASSAGPDLPTPAASEPEWQALASPRPTPLPGAARLAVGDVELAARPAWATTTPVPADLALAELVAAALLTREDVQFVERRRFSAAVEEERRGGPRPSGAPAAGTSPGAEITAHVSWLPLGGGRSALDVRLVAASNGAVVTTRRATVPADADAVSLARSIVTAVLASLREVGRLPSGTASDATDATTAYVPSGVSPRAVDDFLRGLAAEEQWRWEAARVAYQSAARDARFSEASAALARTARLRLGGTLGEN